MFLKLKGKRKKLFIRDKISRAKMKIVVTNEGPAVTMGDGRKGYSIEGATVRWGGGKIMT